MALYTMYRPMQLEEGKTYPLLTWGNGTCALPEGYGTLLRHVASHGFIIVAANTRWTAGSGANAPMIRAVEWALEANDDASSPLYQHVDPMKIGAFGHSQGAGYLERGNGHAHSLQCHPEWLRDGDAQLVQLVRSGRPRHRQRVESTQRHHGAKRRGDGLLPHDSW
jgi:hypothetical protein